MAHTVVEIVAGGKDIVLNGFLRLLGHEGSGQFAGGLPLPVGVRLQQLPLGLFGYVEGVCLAGGHGVEFALQPFVGKFRVGLAASGGDGGAAYHQLVLPDDDGDIVQNMGKCQGAPHDYRFVFCRLIGFCDQPGPGGFDFRHLGVEMRYQPEDSVRFGDFLCVIFGHWCSFPY